eukprot:gene34403-42430_t
MFWTLAEVLEGWFLDLPLTQIHHEDVAAWTAWAFFGMNVSVMTPDERAENDTYVTFLAQKTQYTFQPGFNPSGAPSARLNLDPVFATQRPLIYYVAIAAVNALTHVGLKGIGFKHLPEFDTPSHSQSIFFRPKEIPLGEEEKYNNRKVKPLPIVFVHGIGIGYPHYFSLVASLPTDVDVYLIEWPNVAMQMSSAGPTPSDSQLSDSSTNSPLTVKSDSWDKLSEADGSLNRKGNDKKQHSHSSHTAIEHTIILSSEDSIVPVKEVNRYLEQKQRDGYRNYEVIMTPCVHGEIMLKSNWVKIIVSKVKDRCGLTDPTGENC